MSSSDKPATLDAVCDTADLAECAPSMHVYIPIHISGEGVNRALTRSSTAVTKGKRGGKQSRGNSPSKAGAAAAAAAGVADSCGGDESRQKKNDDDESNSAVSKKDPKLNSHHLSKIPGNFPVPADCSLADLRAQLEHLTRSKVFLGFVDNVTGGLVELREDTLGQFGSVPDQNKAIHCRLLRVAKSKSQQILDAVEKRKRLEQQQHQQQKAGGENESFAVNKSAADAAAAPSSAAGNTSEQPDMKRDQKKRQNDFVNRLCNQDIQRREINRKKLEQSMYPMENDFEQWQKQQQHGGGGGRSTPAPASTNTSGSAVSAARRLQQGGAATPTPMTTTKKLHKREMDESVARLNDWERHNNERERRRNRAREQMIAEGSIVEPGLFKKTTTETVEERCSRFYSHGIDWVKRHEAKVEQAQAAERKRKVPRLGKQDWSEWMERRSKPLERDLIAAKNQPIIRVVGSLAPSAAEGGGAAETSPAPAGK